MIDNKKILIPLFLVVACWVCLSIRCYYMEHYKGENDTISVRIDSVRDTIIIQKIDTLPVVKTSKIIKYVPIKEIITVLDSTMLAEQADSVLPIVQKTFSDDSTYTAYVSGIMPNLDSIIVNQRNIKELIEKTITIKKKKRWAVGVQGGYGIGLINGKPDIYIGFGVSYNIF